MILKTRDKISSKIESVPREEEIGETYLIPDASSVISYAGEKKIWPANTEVDHLKENLETNSIKPRTIQKHRFVRQQH